ncbi:hypothetical protein A1O3_02120 [Capronia epimyces CBS 606.96]|uniref:Heterokaryon incompatibility domain-containing protein n=1 Tax=Capronia epimyces CBS 606.96 TaxID=1182542 RepID=W9YIH4_9EURO|nr:uncharacterized protein A1O3_02120 [Capronia epimyces CBS 606.96]EXJ89056.1 hypothetical protein A1O3_02120 [Capronia epimyces CBS 606.96]
MAHQDMSVVMSATLLALLAITLWRFRGRPEIDHLDKIAISVSATLAALVLLAIWRRPQTKIESSPLPSGSRPSGASFSYEPLEEGQIRLLQFCPQEVGEEDSLCVKLFHAKLSMAPEYVALSYSWGSDDETTAVEIVVNHQRYRVSQHLAEALHRMKMNNITNIWVDAICINQRDIIEKSKEVTRMFTIYRTATMVVIWLGQDIGLDGDAQRFIDLVHDFDQPWEKHHDDVKTLQTALSGLERFLLQRYWSRVWIIQEVAAARRARVFWGPYTVELPSLEALMREHLEWIGDLAVVPRYAQTVLSVRAACRAQQQPRLLEILAMTSDSETSHLRDKVYGLLGLAFDWTIYVREPNYSEHVSENSLCLEMTGAHISWYSSADIIFLRSMHPAQRTLPSWCPDYFHLQVDDFDKNLLSYVCFKDVNLAWEKRRAFGASARMSEVMPDTFHISGNRLTLKGNCLGRITALGSILGEGAGNCKLDRHSPAVEATVTEIAKAFRRLLLLCHSQTFGHLSGLDFLALLYALPGEAFGSVQCTDLRSWLADHEEFFLMFGLKFQPVPSRDGIAVKIRGRAESFCIREEWKEYFGLNDANARTSTRRRREYPLDSVLKSIDLTLQERLRLMCIRDQTLLGWAHRDAELGDVVWHLEGCTLPAILRRSPALSEEHGMDIYQLVGHAYVDPVMASGRWIARENKSRLVHIC